MGRLVAAPMISFVYRRIEMYRKGRFIRWHPFFVFSAPTVLRWSRRWIGMGGREVFDPSRTAARDSAEDRDVLSTTSSRKLLGNLQFSWGKKGKRLKLRYG